ncbi:M20 family peptidase, partial [Ruminococcaceae bacterium OttesenSCG-928-D13]|nr:M20 family peptidase [Ruminococcaceae bacterium OttesenSCG-928-D13]
MMGQTYEKVHQLVDGMKDTLFGISDFVFEHPELGDDEFESSAYLVDLLKNNGFTVEYPYKGIKTAFRADLVMGEGPTVA